MAVSRPLRCYVVEVPIRGRAVYLVNARTAREAEEVVDQGGGEAVDAPFIHRGWSHAKLDGDGQTLLEEPS